jgi:predicted peroxiredoxin
LLVHVTHGPEAPTRAALALLVAKTAAGEGHDVTVFLAGDAAYLAKDAVIEHLRGIGTGAISDTVPALIDAGVPIFISEGSSKTRGVNEADLEGKGAAFATPAKLVELTFAADRVLCY